MQPNTTRILTCGVAEDQALDITPKNPINPLYSCAQSGIERETTSLLYALHQNLTLADNAHHNQSSPNNLVNIPLYVKGITGR